MTLEAFRVSSMIENKFPNSSCAYPACFFRLFPIHEISPPIIGNTTRENRVSFALSIKRVINENIIIKGALIISTKTPIIPPSTDAISLDIRDIKSPFFCSVKNETGSFRNFLYIASLISFVMAVR